MSNLSLVPDTGDELPSRQVARRVRGLMAEHRLTGRKLAAAMHMDQRAFSRRYSGKVPWSIDEVAVIARLMGTSLASIMAVEEADWYVECAIRDSNPEPADLEETRADLRLVLGLPVADFSMTSISDTLRTGPDQGLDKSPNAELSLVSSRNRAFRGVDTRP